MQNGHHRHRIAWLPGCSHAQQLGANAIISMRYDATDLMAGLTEVLCCGTVVVVEPGDGA